MCECGCAQVDYRWFAPGPPGEVYLFAVYDSCRDCDTPAGVDVARMKREELKEWGWDRLPELAFNHGDMVGIAVLHPAQLKKRLVAAGLDEFDVDDAVDESFHGAIADTTKEYGPATVKKKRRAAKEK